MKQIKVLLLASLITSLFTGCGGGGGGPSDGTTITTQSQDNTAQWDATNWDESKWQ